MEVHRFKVSLYFLCIRDTVSNINRDGNVKILLATKSGLHESLCLALFIYLTALFCMTNTVFISCLAQDPQKHIPYRKWDSISAKYAYLAISFPSSLDIVLNAKQFDDNVLFRFRM